MKNLIPLQDNVKLAYRSSFSSKQEPYLSFLNAHLAHVEQAIDAYHAAAPLLLNLQPQMMSDTDRVNFQSIYSSKTKEFRSYLALLRTSQPTNFQKDICQYCGINLNRSIDHFFPKETYPMFSGVISNLIPCCKDCNQLKGLKTYSNGQRSFINLYHDTYLNIPFLICNVHFIPTLNINFTLDLAGLPQPAQLIVSNHFRELNLLQTYNSAIGTFFESTARECRGYDNASLRDSITRKINSLESVQGTNCFQVALLKALLQNINHFHGFINQ
ncbi:HNH endonuclease [Peredibacter starrii]|uniref:HNH endonuclease n=1 Tax=Peredibacter starrii TaxID=28202 RepID=A0AAX4HRV2_9BACT|nr:HNH endonuclease [Peredibacter starrii]WPU65900.1 HNH endonuclease [Peredibacter starrii]